MKASRTLDGGRKPQPRALVAEDRPAAFVPGTVLEVPDFFGAVANIREMAHDGVATGNAQGGGDGQQCEAESGITCRPVTQFAVSWPAAIVIARHQELAAVQPPYNIEGQFELSHGDVTEHEHSGQQRPDLDFLVRSAGFEPATF